MDAEFGIYADEILYQLRSTNFSNEYWDMNNTCLLYTSPSPRD